MRGDSWRIFRVEVGKLSGRLGMLTRRIPPLPETRNGKPFLDWDQGMPLHKFLALVCRTEGSNPVSSLGKRAKSIDNSDIEKSQEDSQMRITDMVHL